MKDILIVDDIDVNRYIIKIIVSSFNKKIKIFEASNGKDALDIMTNRDNNILILMDIRMPIMDGIESTKEIRKIHKDLDIIAISANGYDEKKILKSGFNDYIQKPYTVEKLNIILNKYFKK